MLWLHANVTRYVQRIVAHSSVSLHNKLGRMQWGPLYACMLVTLGWAWFGEHTPRIPGEVVTRPNRCMQSHRSPIRHYVVITTNTMSIGRGSNPMYNFMIFCSCNSYLGAAYVEQSTGHAMISQLRQRTNTASYAAKVRLNAPSICKRHGHHQVYPSSWL